MFHEISASGLLWTSDLDILYAHLITTRCLFWLSSLQRQLATRLTQLSDRLPGKQLLKNFQKPTKNGLKNTKNCTIDYNLNCPPTFL
ncbi:hypothetical protein QHH11_11810 [Aphanizomenon sp. PH219]|nr:hypothetical protein [Aphanizomenon sp. 202]MDK2459812.1 hypothetical protein [Aphanizomenon sp. PH219]